MVFDPGLPAWHLPLVAIGAGYLALAAWLLVLDFPSRLNRAFALYLVLDSGSAFARLFDWGTPDGFAIRMVSVTMTVAAPFALLYFMVTYEQLFGARRWRQRALLPLLVTAVLLAGVVLYEPSWYDGPSLGPIGHLTSWLHVLTPCVAALVFGREATRHGADTSRRHALLLASLAFAAGPLFSALHLLVPGIMGAPASEQAARLVALLPLGLLVGHMARVAWGPDDTLRHEARRFLAALTLPVASAFLFAASTPLPLLTRLWLMTIMMAVWMLALPLLVTYALVRHRLFDIDVKIRWGISKSTVAAIFIAAFFVVSEAAQQFLGDTIGSTYAGIAAAGALVFAIAPLQRVAERLAERAVPAPPPAPTQHGRVDLYRIAVRKFLADGRLSDEEEIALAELAQELGIGAGAALALRKEIEREARQDAAAPGEAP